MNTVAVLFARADSVYKAMPGVDVYDIDRDARTFPGGMPMVAHPPCRAWGRLRHMANPMPHEKNLARWSVAQIRLFGGVLEHPSASTLWADQSLPVGRSRDEFGGFTLPICQHWWGHRAEKKTLLYIVGCDPGDVPDVPYVMGAATHVVSTGSTNHIQRGQPGWRPSISHAEREHTPEALAIWLVDLARRCKVTEAA